MKPFSHSSVKALKAQLKVSLVADLCLVPQHRIAELQEVSYDEKTCLLELCERLRWQLSVLKDTRKLPTRNTFIHFDVKASDHLRYVDGHVQNEVPNATGQLQSAPPKIEQVPFRTRVPENEYKHLKRKCSPCAYYYKPDSCRQGAQCEFCHLCPKGEIKLRKKEKARAVRCHERGRPASARMMPKTSDQAASALGA